MPDGEHMVSNWPPPFESFNSIPRFARTVIITEKMDGTNAQVIVPADPSLPLAIGSRNRWIQPESIGGKGADNYGFAEWVMQHEEMIRRLGPGKHFGEWWGSGIGPRRYGQTIKRWSLFDTRWTAAELRARGLPENVHVVPTLAIRELEPDCGAVQQTIEMLMVHGSVAAPGFMDPEGIVIRHTKTGQLFKWTFDGDGREKTKPKKRGPLDLPPVQEQL